MADKSVGAEDPIVRQAKDRVGRTLRGKWRLDTLLGVGGMAAVYAATHRNGKRAAVKVLHPEMSVHEVVRQRFLMEGYVANAVGHPGAVSVIDDDSEEDGLLFLVTELLDGETLEERAHRMGGRMPEREVLIAMNQLLDVLAAAHTRGIVHRDLKPENVFVTRAGQIKVLDFGIARLRELSSNKHRTQTGVVMGTPAYMAPEYARGHSDEIDERADIWACGAMMFRLLSGGDVHEGATVNEQLMSAMTKAAPPIASAAPHVSDAVAPIIDRALAFQRDRRWPSAREMRDALAAAYGEAYGGPVSSAPRLLMASTVPDRTQPRSQSPAPPAVSPRPTTGRPVTFGSVAGLRSWSQRRYAIGVGAGAGALILLAVTSWAVRPSHAHGAIVVPAVSLTSPPPLATAISAASEARSDPSPDIPPPPAAVAEPPDEPTRTVPVADLPSAPPERPSAPEPVAKKSAPAARSTHGVDCHPPFVVDPDTGKKRWKLECL